MRINAFFEHRLRAPLFNHVWSWGAIDTSSNRVFLRTNEEHLFDDNGEWALIYNPDWNKSNGHAERLRHIDAMRRGSRAYAVVVTFNDNGKISSFDDESLLRLGEIVEEDGLIYARVMATEPIDAIMRSTAGSRIAHDIFDLWAGNGRATQRESMVLSRIGQGAFRTAVLRCWDYRCAVTGVSTLAAIRASHIKPWRESSKTERLDPYNGLPLVATIDSLFDSGHVSFSNDGLMLIADVLTESDVDALGLSGLRLRSRLSSRSKAFMRDHRDNVFLGGKDVG
ncbi:HNH endonuclease [Crateriforma conspicua]|uniref:HNH nuclease domain-containing protein n=1 Tax=Crateriforma conspicua TaxID=2527996 RepID=A0A5C5YDY7_9PLAN|nr:HNH endonuclease [Crateriforma conspicua]TWT72671.1 hypothetical protein Pan14r_49910 [Crateriforma conspicua]